MTTPSNNYMDSRTPEERKQDSAIKETTVSTSTPNSKWQEQMDDLFADCEWYGSGSSHEIKSFIESVIEEVLEEVAKEIEMHSRAKVGDDPKSTEFAFKQYGLKIATETIYSFIGKFKSEGIQ